METYLKTLNELFPGDNAGVLLKGLQRTDIRRGKKQFNFSFKLIKFKKVWSFVSLAQSNLH